MNDTMYRSFGDELVKIAMWGTVARGAKAALKAGWKESGDWLGKGKYTKKLPIGGKSLTVGVPAIGAASVAPQEDPGGQERSRLERGLGLAGDVVGGLAGVGGGSILANRLAQTAKAGPKMTKFLGGTGAVMGGIAGGLILPRLLTAPSRMMRERRQRQEAQAAMQAQPEQQVIP